MKRRLQHPFAVEKERQPFNSIFCQRADSAACHLLHFSPLFETLFSLSTIYLSQQLYLPLLNKEPFNPSCTPMTCCQFWVDYPKGPRDAKLPAIPLQHLHHETRHFPACPWPIPESMSACLALCKGSHHWAEGIPNLAPLLVWFVVCSAPAVGLYITLRCDGTVMGSDHHPVPKAS